MSKKLTIRHIDGPMLPQIHPFTSPTIKPQGNTSLVPTITPPMNQTSNTGGPKEQYLLVPNPRSIIVRSMHHGRRVCALVPEKDGDVIRSMTLAWLPGATADDEDNDTEQGDTGATTSGEWIILAGCQDGSIQEWAVPTLSLPYSEYCSSISMPETPHEDGRKPRRIFQLELLGGEKQDDVKFENLEILHLTSPGSSDEHMSKSLSNTRGGSLLFALVKVNSSESSPESATWLTRCTISPCRNVKHEKVSANMSLIASLKVIDSETSMEEFSVLQTRHVCMREGDSIFGFLAAYRSDQYFMSAGASFAIMGGNMNAGDVFVVMCSSFGLIVYHEKADDEPDVTSIGDNLKSLPLVHFTGDDVRHIAHSSSDGHLFSSVAISPDVKDIVVGRSDGKINLLDDIFDCIKDYLGAFRSKMNENGNDKLSEIIESLQHPQVSLIKRTVHWHSHPPVAIAFLAGSSVYSPSMTKSLVSGGEENVLATWQLDRNFHRPTHFLARVSQGAIMHISCCHRSGKIVIACADNSIHCHNGANYNELWVEQGLASMPLHKEDKPIGSIILMKDPITKLPVLTNLPGAPGMIHWFDPSSNSVAGILEVAPYNRVSRRDRDNDPHVPVPTVTHMAMGGGGKDLVTVDEVWTENLSVGSLHSITTPNNTVVPMNKCTSIKFWMYKEASKKGNADLQKGRNNHAKECAMNYELISSMTAPHGRDGSVCALDIAQKGYVACTLSQQENAFRVWAKNTASEEVLWKCLYKVKTPSGLSNMLSQKVTPPSHERLVSFSSDGSVLSVCYGPVVTLWDHSNATLLTSLSTDGNISSNSNQTKLDIREAHFMNATDDTLLLTTKRVVYTKSPFGGGSNKYLGNDEWALGVGSLGDEKGSVSTVIPLPGFGRNRGAGGFFLAAVSAEDKKRSTVSVVDREKGKLLHLDKSNEIPMQWQVNGGVKSMAMNACHGSSLQVVVITDDYNMISLSTKDDMGEIACANTIMRKVAGKSQLRAPTLKFTALNKEPETKRRKISIGINRRFEKNRYAGFDFPALSGKFTTSFIANSLG